MYWFAAALNQAGDFSDDISEWPVDMLVEIDAKVLKNDFTALARNIMDKIKR